VVECLSGKHGSPSSIPRTVKKTMSSSRVKRLNTEPDASVQMLNYFSTESFLETYLKNFILKKAILCFSAVFLFSEGRQCQAITSNSCDFYRFRHHTNELF
jgi:hypothetical protein